MRTRLGTAALAAVAVFVVGLGLSDASKHGFFLGDFRAFYCAGVVLGHAQDPYAALPLMRCESVHQPFQLYTAASGLAVPAPFPGYALAFFAIFGVLPYAAAAFLWLVISIVCAVIAGIVLAKLINRPVLGMLLPFCMIYGLVVFPLGQLTSIVLCALVLAAAAIRHGNLRLTPIFLCFIALLPHVAVGIFLTLFSWLRQARAPVMVAAATLVILDLFAGGTTLALLYFTKVLPAHAHSEVAGTLQYSSTWLARAAGSSVAAALKLGDIWYGLMIIWGIVVGGLLAKKFNDNAFLVLIPPAFAVFGGVFVHIQEISLALPGALLMHSRGDRNTRILAGGAVLLVAVPWMQAMSLPWLIVVIAIVTIGIASRTLGLGNSISLRASLGALAICACIMIVTAHYGTHVTQRPPSFNVASGLAQESWAMFVRKGVGVTLIVAKAPTWIGLLFLLAACSHAARSSRKAFCEARIH